MTVPHLKTHEQIHLDSEIASRHARRRAAQCVRANIADVTVQEELLATLGLLDDAQPSEPPTL